jgi:hypothetical protein
MNDVGWLHLEKVIAAKIGLNVRNVNRLKIQEGF